jgi:filamentous hemagglutinin
VTFTTTQPTNYVRVYADSGSDTSKQAGEWMFKAEDVAGLSAEQIASKYALPQVPTAMADVTVPAGQTVHVSVANDIQIKRGIGGNGGGGRVQFEVLVPNGSEVPSSWFSNPRGL